jgi:hypothetical protein
MFSPTSTTRTAAPSWLQAVRRTVDLAVAFATLESYTSARELLPRRDSDGASSASPHGLNDVSAWHPHRTALRAPARPGRAGAVRAREQDCITPSIGRPRRCGAQHLAR